MNNNRSARFLLPLLFVLAVGLDFGFAQDDEVKSVYFFGDSITAGLGVAADEAFPALIQHKIDSLGWDFEVVNAGLSGETSAGGVRRVNWVLREQPALFVLELGGNDGLRGIDLDDTKKNLQTIIDRVEEKYPETRIVVAGMQVPPNLGPEYTTQFKNMYPELAEENDAAYIPFILEGAGGYDKFMQGDGIHPNAAGHEIVAHNVWEVLKPILNDLR